MVKDPPKNLPKDTSRDPLLNEELILAQLRDETMPITSNTMRTLCSLVLMCAWDRKIDREFYGQLLDAVALIQIDLSDMESTGRLRVLAEAYKSDLTELDAAGDRIAKEFMAKRRSLADKFDVLHQCPTSADTIH